MRRKVTYKFPVYGDYVKSIEMKLKVTGERDFRKILWTLLEDED